MFGLKLARARRRAGSGRLARVVLDIAGVFKGCSEGAGKPTRGRDTEGLVFVQVEIMAISGAVRLRETSAHGWRRPGGGSVGHLHGRYFAAVEEHASPALRGQPELWYLRDRHTCRQRGSDNGKNDTTRTQIHGTPECPYDAKDAQCPSRGG